MAAQFKRTAQRVNDYNSPCGGDDAHGRQGTGGLRERSGSCSCPRPCLPYRSCLYQTCWKRDCRNLLQVIAGVNVCERWLVVRKWGTWSDTSQSCCKKMVKVNIHGFQAKSPYSHTNLTSSDPLTLDKQDIEFLGGPKPDSCLNDTRFFFWRKKIFLLWVKKRCWLPLGKRSRCMLAIISSAMFDLKTPTAYMHL